MVPAAGAQRQHVPRVIEIICMSGSMSGASPSARLKPLPPPAIKALGASMERKLPSHCLCGAAPKRTAHAEMEALMKRSIGLSHVLSGAMALCIACPVPEVTAAAAVLAATFTAHAQDTEVRGPPRKTRVPHDLVRITGSEPSLRRAIQKANLKPSAGSRTFSQTVNTRHLGGVTITISSRPDMHVIIRFIT